MALWHLILTLICLAFFVLLLILIEAPEDSPANEDGYAFTVLAGIVLVGGGVLSTLLLSGISLALLGKSFFSPPWSVLIIPGLLGTMAAIVGSFVGWPVSEAIGAFIAYHLVGGRLSESRGNIST